MPWPAELAQHLVRTVHLLALAVVPRGPSPDPLPPEPLALWGALAAALLAALLWVAAHFGAWTGSRLAQIGGALVWVAVATALGAEMVYQGDAAPLGRGAPLVAVPAWAALATVAAAAADLWLGSSFKHKRMGAAIVVIGAGATLLLQAAKLLGSPDRMWWAALRRDAGHARAVDELAEPFRKKRKHDEMQKLAARCLEVHRVPAGQGVMPAATCACLELRAEAALRLSDPSGALRDAEAMHGRCPAREGARATLAEALAVAGQPDAAEAEARAALEAGGDPARLRYALALALERARRYAEAKQEIARAIDAGAGREARLFAGALAIVTGDLDEAVRWLQPLVVEDPDDAEARYNLALVADKRGDYNGARQGYLATLKASPRNADARYNLALLTFRAGVTEEAHHHVRKYQEMFPDDPRGAQLAQTTGAPVRQAPAPPPRGSAAPAPRAP